MDSPCFFTPAIHSRIVQFILDRKRFTNDSKNDFGFGIERLLNDKAYVAAYPLHDVSNFKYKINYILGIIFIRLLTLIRRKLPLT